MSDEYRHSALIYAMADQLGGHLRDAVRATRNGSCPPTAAFGTSPSPLRTEFRNHPATADVNSLSSLSLGRNCPKPFFEWC